jgi:predicted nucleic acid-binding protein
MDEINERLADHAVLGLDPAIFLFHLQAHDEYLPLTRAVLKGVQAGRWQGVITTAALIEITAYAWRVNRSDVADQYALLLTSFPNLHVVDIDRTVARRAAQLRAIYNLHTLDALNLAAALNRDATAWLTWDAGLARLEPLVEVVVMDQCVAYE